MAKDKKNCCPTHRCCCCLELHCGVRTIATLTIVLTVFGTILSFLDMTYFDIFWPITAVDALLSLMWLKVFLKQTDNARMTVISIYLFGITIASNLFFAYSIRNGDVQTWYCDFDKVNFVTKTNTIKELIESISDDIDLRLGSTFDNDSCKSDDGSEFNTRYIIYGLLALKVIFNLYYTFVIMKWINFKRNELHSYAKKSKNTNK